MEHFKFLIIIFLVINQNYYSQTHPNENIDRLLRNGINEIVKQNYQIAERTFRQLDEEHPKLPLGKIYLAATLIAKSFDYGIPFDEDQIISSLNEAKKISENLLKENKNNLWYKYYYALTEGYNAYYLAINGSILDAFSIGLKSYNLFEDILNQDSSFQDALLAVGTFKYWRSDKLKFLSWLPFVKDERAIAINQLETSIRNNSYNSHLAIYSLIWIFINEKEYLKAKNLAELALRKFPQSRLFKEALARIYENIDLSQSILLYTQLLNSYKDLKLENRVREITINHKIAIQLQKSGEKKQALKICNEILSINDLSDYEKSQLSERLQRIRKMRQELLNQN
ncbi:MAG: hypothetical protein NZM09_04555 [Ignavibacterium sp.]|nr:hypothetical protein [Ignavibacterium sp.]MDW8374948.1 hypothetical protein [Ignavibacteriales bacterium]